MEQIALRLTVALQNETIVMHLVVAALKKGNEILGLVGPPSERKTMWWTWRRRSFDFPLQC
jgi:hypothetical protein